MNELHELKTCATILCLLKIRSNTQLKVTGIKNFYDYPVSNLPSKNKIIFKASFMKKRTDIFT